MSKTTVGSVFVKSVCPSPLTTPNKLEPPAGSSSLDFKFKGVYSDNGKCVVVLEANAECSTANSKVNGAKTGGIFHPGKDGKFCCLRTDQSDLQNWTVTGSSDKDAVGAGKTFVAGTGGGGH